MSIARQLRNAPRSVLREHIAGGYPVDPSAIEGFTYRGTSLGLPEIAAKISWKTFQKAFHRDELTGRLLGWNVRLHQDGVDAPSRPILREGRPLCVWHYEVIEPRGVPMPAGFDRGLIIDYGRGDNPMLASVRWMKDPLVSLSPDHSDELIGVSYLVVGGRCVETPTYFTLEREHRTEYVPYGGHDARV